MKLQVHRKIVGAMLAPLPERTIPTQEIKRSIMNVHDKHGTGRYSVLTDLLLAKIEIVTGNFGTNKS